MTKPGFDAPSPGRLRAALLLVITAGLFALVFAAACGGEEDPIDIIPPPATATPTESVAGPTPEPTPEPTEFRVAYINLFSPLTLDETNTVPSETFKQRLAIVIEELKLFKPDLVAFSEVTWTEQHGDAAAILAAELKMEPLKVRTKPWFAGQSQEKNEALVKQLGFEESELILVRGRAFPTPDGAKIWLNPRTSEVEVPGALWMRVKGPGNVADFDVFVTHLTGIDARARAQQAADFAEFVKGKVGDGPAIILGDFGDGAEAASIQPLLELGFKDAYAPLPVVTCCRESVLGQQPDLTSRTDYLLVKGWTPSVLDVFADTPRPLDDGQLLYASDHNGITALFPIPIP